jgi:hypothetical protein
MKLKKLPLLPILALACFTIAGNTYAQKKVPSVQGSSVPLDRAKLVGDEKITTPYGVMELQHNYLTDESSQNFLMPWICSVPHRHICGQHLWSVLLPGARSRISTTDPMPEALLLSFVSFREKQGIVTANLDNALLYTFDNLSNGPLYIDYPAGMTAGAAMDFLAATCLRPGPHRPG